MTTPQDDVDAIMRIMQVAFDPAFGEAWNRSQVMDALLMGHCHYELASEAGALVGDPELARGFFLSRHNYDEEELLLLAVDPACRRRGIGHYLLGQFASSAMERHSKRLLLEMRRGNPAAELYLNFGFKQVGLRQNYYKGINGSRHDAITFAMDCH